jgi:hypothetical protein
MIRLAKKNRPRLLFIPTASSDSARYWKHIQEYFGEFLKCNRRDFPDQRTAFKKTDSEKDFVGRHYLCRRRQRTPNDAYLAAIGSGSPSQGGLP